jgi:hypothetical protein
MSNHAALTDKNRLTKADTVALWHAVNWTETVLKEWRREGIKDDTDKAKFEAERARLLEAKRALRKVNAIRKNQSPTPNQPET